MAAAARGMCGGTRAAEIIANADALVIATGASFGR